MPVGEGHVTRRRINASDRKSQDLRRTYRFTGLLLENWRNFVDGDVNLQRRAFLVGPNASGKSNFLDVFSLSLRHSSRRGRVPGSGQEARRGFRASRTGRQTILGHRAPSDGRERRTQAAGGRCRVSTSHPGVRGRGGRGGPREESNRPFVKAVADDRSHNSSHGLAALAPCRPGRQPPPQALGPGPRPEHLHHGAVARDGRDRRGGQCRATSSR